MHSRVSFHEPLTRSDSGWGLMKRIVAVAISGWRHFCDVGGGRRRVRAVPAQRLR
jgi:hypothetical protein